MRFFRNQKPASEPGKTQKLVLSGLLAAAGLILPFATAHAFGIPGTILLPMHLPVLLLGFLCGPFYGAVGGLIIPILSSILTGMPPVFPMLPIMAGELFTYGLVGGLLYRKAGFPLLPSLLLSMLGGRAVYGLIYAALFTANNGQIKALSVSAAFLEGIPGILLQVVFIPILVTAVQKAGNRTASAIFTQTEEKNTALQMIREGRASFVILREERIVHSADGRGVSPLLSVLENQPELLKDAAVMDKIIGKAAAMLLVLGGAKEAYGETMSRAAYTYLTGKNIAVGFGRCIDVISNRNGDGICPLEKAVRDVEAPSEAYEVLKETISRMKKNTRVS